MKKVRLNRMCVLRELDDDSVLAVLGGGQVSFELPRGWVYRMNDSGLAAYDREPLENDCILEATLICHPPGPIPDLPLRKMLHDSLTHLGKRIPIEEIVVESRVAFQLARVQYEAIYPNHDRIAVFCSCLIRGSGFHVQLSYAYWPEEAERLAPVWTRALDSFEVGRPTPGYLSAN